MEQAIIAAIIAVIVALIGAVTTICGWFVLQDLTHKRETEARQSNAQMADRTRRLELQIKYHERQIQELYAPLHANIQLIQHFRPIREEFVEKISDEQVHKIRDILEEHFYRPLHMEVREILKTKVYLIDGAKVPESFSQYLRHSLTQEMKLRSEDAGINASDIWFPWPPEFPEVVEAGLNKALRSYEGIIQELAGSAAVASSDEPATIDQPTVAGRLRKLAGKVVRNF